MTNGLSTGAGWNFDNSYARLPEFFYARQEPVPVRAPELIVLNEPLAASLGLNAEALRSGEGAAILAGNRVPDGAEPLAEAYAGHQFGYFTMLGDGRAILLGEQIAPGGRRFDIQLKGSGRTPYSRGGDGRAALGPMLREYIVSEAMHALGIPTTRSLAVTATGQSIQREKELPGAVLTRVAASHLRVGTFEYAARFGSVDDVRTLADYALERHGPGMAAGVDSAADAGAGTDSDGNRYRLLLRGVIRRQAALIAKWQLVGFVHGVMNTDNMTISGETIDYGPCAFMDAYDPATVFSSIDSQGRYAYGRQPQIGAWNLARLAESLLPLLGADPDRAAKQAEEELRAYGEQFRTHWLAGMRAKLGLFGEEESDEALAADLLELMRLNRADYTNTFRALTLDLMDAAGGMFATAAFTEWRKRWEERRGRQSESEEASRRLMRANNPAVIPRNHRVEEALEAAVERGDLGVMNRLLAALADPYAYSPGQDEYAALPESCDVPYRTYCGT